MPGVKVRSVSSDGTLASGETSRFLRPNMVESDVWRDEKCLKERMGREQPDMIGMDTEKFLDDEIEGP